jgi:hypothetical protein
MLENFKRANATKSGDIERFKREIVGENQLLDDAGNLARDIHGQVYPMYSAEIPY